MNYKILSKSQQHILEQAIYMVSLILILWSSIIVFNGIYTVIKYEIAHKLNQYEDLIYVLSKVFKSHSALLMLPIFIMIFSIIWKKFHISFFAISIVLSFNIPSYYFFDSVLHPFLFNLHLYDFLLREGQTVLNPQYTKLFIMSLLLIILVSMSLIKKYRSIDRIFISLISSSVLITLFIFHIALPMGIFKFSIEQLEKNLEREVQITSLDKLCQNKSCFIIDKNLNVIKENKKGSEEKVVHYSYFFYQAINYYEQSNGNSFTGALGNFKGQEFDYIITVVKKENENYFVVMDENIGKPYSRQSEIWFSFLTTCAHFVWIYGGLGLLFLHKNRFLKKRKQTELFMKNEFIEK